MAIQYLLRYYNRKAVAKFIMSQDRLDIKHALFFFTKGNPVNNKCLRPHWFYHFHSLNRTASGTSNFVVLFTRNGKRNVRYREKACNYFPSTVVGCIICTITDFTRTCQGEKSFLKAFYRPTNRARILQKFVWWPTCGNGTTDFFRKLYFFMASLM